MKKAERHLKLRQVEIFLEAARQGKAEASRALGITPSALFQSIADLERDLGDVVLFDRSQRGLLTPAGEVLVEQGKRLLEDEEAARRAVARSLEAEGTGPLRLAYTPEFAGTVALLMKELSQGRSNVTTTEADVETVGRLVTSASIDLALTPGAPLEVLPKQMAHEVFFVPEVRFIAKDDRFVIDGKYVPLDSLTDEPFAFPWFETETPPEQREARTVVEEYFARHGFTPKRVAYYGNSLATMLDIVASGEAVSIYPISEAAQLRGVSLSLPKPWPRSARKNIYYRRSESVAALAERIASHSLVQFEEQRYWWAKTETPTLQERLEALTNRKLPRKARSKKEEEELRSMEAWLSEGLANLVASKGKRTE